MSLDRFLYRLIRKGELTFLTMVGKTVTMADVSQKILQYDADGNVLMSTGLTMPVDGHAGYAKGALFIDTNVGAGTSGRYTNVGTTAACNFDLEGTLSAGGVTLAHMAALTRGDLIRAGAAGAPEVVSAKTAGKIMLGDGTDVISATMSGNATINAAGAVTLAADCVTPAMMTETAMIYAAIAIPAVDVVDTSAGKLGHAQGQILVASPGATKVIELISAVVIYDWDGAAQYGAGSALAIGYSGGGTVLTGSVAATFLTTGADAMAYFQPTATAATTLTKDKGLNLVIAGAAFTTAGAVGVIRVKLCYRVHTHGLA
jgi:hypothetical protein